jgi:hypothetical protein
MRKLCLSIAIGIASGMPLASATQTAGDLAGSPEGEPIFRCVVDYLRVDGLPLVQHSWCTRARPGGPIIPLLSLKGQGIVFGIRPWSAPDAPPIPKRQRPLE